MAAEGGPLRGRPTKTGLPAHRIAAAPSRGWLVPICFFLSGAAGLVLEIVWSKYLSLLLGNSVQGVSTVVAAFLGGLGIGAWLGGRFASRTAEPLAAYAKLEIFIGAAGLATPLAYAAARPLFEALYSGLGGGGGAFHVVRFLVLFASLLAPTVAMGATLPLLVSDLERRGGSPRSIVAVLYAINTAGAVAGVACAAFLLIPALGLWQTAVAASVLDFAVAAAVLIGRPRAPGPAADVAASGAASRAGAPPSGAGAPAPARSNAVRAADAARAGGPSGAGGPAGAPVGGRAAAAATAAPSRRAMWTPRLVVPFMALSGFTAILDEIAWTRILSVTMGGMVYALAAILALYLLGIAAGSATASRLLRGTHDAARLFALLQIGLASSVAAGTWLFPRLPEWQIALLIRSGGSAASLFLGDCAIAASIVLVPAFCLGALFPTAAAIVREGRAESAPSVGVVYAANTAGSIAGSLLTGFVLIPAFGALPSILAGAVLNAAIGIATALTGVRKRREAWTIALAAAGAALAFALLARPSWDEWRMSLGFARLLRTHRGQGDATVRDLVAEGARARAGEKVVFYREGRLASVAVLQTKDRRVLVVNGKPDASIGSGEDMMTQVMIGHLPILFLPPRREPSVFVVGYGSGVTTHAVLTHPVGRVKTVEIERAVIEAAPQFREGAFDPLEDPRSDLVIDDAGLVLRSARERFDAIISEPSNPWIAGVGDLFTREFYEAAKSRLVPDGVFCQWIQGYEISPEMLGTIFRTLASTFPSGQVFYFDASNDIAVLASPRPRMDFDPGVLRAAFARGEVARDLARVGIGAPEDLLRHYRGRLDRMARDAGPGPVNTDDNGWLEHRAPLDMLLPPPPGPLLVWNEKVVEDLVGSIPGPDEEKVRLLLAAAERALGAKDRAGARGLLAGARRVRPEPARLVPDEGVMSRKDGDRDAGARPAPVGDVTHAAQDGHGGDGPAHRIAKLEKRIEDAERAAKILAATLPLLQKATQTGDRAEGERAAAMLSRAHELDPSNGEIVWRHGTALIAAGRPDEAIGLLNDALTLLPVPRRLTVHRDLALAHYARGTIQESLRALDEMDRIEPGTAEARYWRARILRDRGDDARARDEIEAGLRDHPDDRRLRALRDERR